LGTEEIGGGAGNCAMGSGAVPPRCAYEEEHCHAPRKIKRRGPSASNRGEKRILLVYGEEISLQHRVSIRNSTPPTPNGSKNGVKEPPAPPIEAEAVDSTEVVMLEGVVMRSGGGFYEVDVPEEEERLLCSLGGRLKRQTRMGATRRRWRPRACGPWKHRAKNVHGEEWREGFIEELLREHRNWAVRVLTRPRKSPSPI
jgi:hypothetical protein